MGPARVVLRCAGGAVVAELPRAHAAGLFAGAIAEPPIFRYRLRAEGDRGLVEFDDIYSFPPVLGDLDAHLLAEGRHLEAYKVMGAHCRKIDGVDGISSPCGRPMRVVSAWSANSTNGMVGAAQCEFARTSA
jgi:1,4-alpha-glucan branching enzyme